MFTLSYTENGAPKRHPLHEGVTLVGRSPACDLRIDEVSISGRHAGSVPSFVEKEKRRNLLLTKQIAQRGEGGIRREEGYHD